MRGETALVAIATVLALTITSGVVVAAAWSTPTSGTVYLQSNSGVAVGVAGGPDINMTQPFINDSAIDIETEAGNITVRGPGAATVKVPKQEIEGTFTNVTTLDVSQNNVTINPDDKPAVTVSGDADRLDFRDMVVDDGAVDFVYAGASGTTNLTARGLPASTLIVAVDNTSQIVAKDTTDANGRLDLTGMDNSVHAVSLSGDGEVPVLQNLQPSGGISTEPSTLDVDVSDPDFPEGDNVSVSASLDGSPVGTQTITSNQTVSFSVPSRGLTGGNHSWSVTAEDAYTKTTTASTDYQVPANLTIVSETNTSKLIDNTTVEVTFFYESGGVDTGEKRNTTDGTLNLTGLPVDQPIVVKADADGYQPRRIFLSSLFEQRKVYLLNKSEQFTKTIFNLRDFTGEYPQDTTVLKIQRLYNGSYETVLGDYFGANGQFPGQLDYNTRYRLVLSNTGTGQRRVLGSYTPLSSTEERLSISPTGNITGQGTSPAFAVQPQAELFPAETIQITPELVNNSKTVTSWNTTAYLVENNSLTVLFSEQRQSPGSFDRTINLTGHANATVRIESEWTTTDGLSYNTTLTYGIVPKSDAPNLIDGLDQLVTQVPQGDRGSFKEAVAILVTVVGTTAAGSALAVPAEAVGLVGVMLLTGWAIMGWLGYDIVFVALVAWGAIAYLRRRY